MNHHSDLLIRKDINVFRFLCTFKILLIAESEKKEKKFSFFSFSVKQNYRFH